MATVLVNLEVKSSGEAVLKTTAAGFDGVGAAAKRADETLKGWDNTAQRAAQRMERMHEAALKMNSGLTTTNDKAQLFAATLSQVSSTATSSAAALGLPIGPLTTLNQILPVASIGFTQLNTAAAGFTIASAGVVGAGLAIGVAIGTMLRQISFVSKAFDDGIMAIAKFVGYAKDAPTDMAAFTKSIAALNAEGQKLRDKAGPDPVFEAAALDADKVAKAAEKAAAARIAAAEKAAKAEVALQQWATNTWLLSKEKEAAAAKAISDRQAKDQEAFYDRMAAKAKQFAEDRIKAEADWAEKKEQLALAMAEDEAERDRKRLESLANVFGFMSDMLGQTMALFQAFGVSADSAIGKVVSSLGILADAASNVFSQLASGDILGAIGAGIGGVVGLIGNLFGGKSAAEKRREEMEKLRQEAIKLQQEFIKSMGGLDALMAKANQAGVSLDGLFDVSNAEEMQQVIDDIGRQIGLWEEATDKTNEAMERYGITIDQMGEKFAQQELDKQAMQLYEDYMLLTGAGADVALVNERMAAAINEYVQTSIRAGTTIPENMRPILEALLKQGLLVDEAGTKLETLDGITFGESTTAMEDLVGAVRDLVEALERAFQLSGNLNTSLGNTPSGPGGGYEPQEGGGFAEGGYIPPRPGGWNVTVGEGGEGEYIIPKSKMGGAAGQVSLNAPLTVHVNGSTMTGEMLAKEINKLWTNNTAGILDRTKSALGHKRIA